MAHPIHQANENSPYGTLTREEFHVQNHILHHQSFMLNNRNMKIYTQSWRPDLDNATPLRGFVGVIHGYTAESSWLLELSAVAIAKSGFLVSALDLQGHGYSQGYPGHIPNIEHVVDDCVQLFDSIRAENPNIPAFLYGESLGGAIAILLCLKQKKEWDGLILHGAMCGVSRSIKPIWPIEKLLPVAACIAPKWKIVITRPPESMSYKEVWKRKLVAKSPNRHRLASGKPLAATALEFLRVCEFIERNCHEIEVPLMIVHGAEDRVCEPKSAKKFYEMVSSKEKSLEIVKGMWHMLIGEPNETVELVFGRIISWICKRADKYNQC
ncbi:Caffeoylshikimate esterase [Heracleum sosnowskyi]|uniref:Caffeoylshikimate esterase n=1 Tax=Heracleum sosnowskyi TaxID=360622 RepID=A0AAD8I049_9APIA|nr:Caffeoylshikimate esterase [Heracleum sosnowskyi]